MMLRNWNQQIARRWSALRVVSAAQLSSSPPRGREVAIGDVKVSLRAPESPELVPRGYLQSLSGPEVLEHMRWIIQKRIMSQDIFLLGFPTNLRRRLVMAAAELCDWEVLLSYHIVY
jgi:hypothetical protein